MRRIGVVLVIGGALWCSTVFVARVEAGVCKDNAIATYLNCKSQCKSDFVDAKLTCRNIQPACGEACLAGRQQCFDDVERALDTGVVTGHCSATTTDSCHVDADCSGGEMCVVDSTLTNCSGGTNACQAAFLDTATNTCGATCTQGAQPPCTCGGNQNCQDCIDQAQVTDFLCHDGCRDSFRTNPTVIAMKATCRSAFQACVHACPPANSPTPTATP